MNLFNFYLRLFIYYFMDIFISRGDKLKIICFSNDFIGRHLACFDFYELLELDWIDKNVLKPMRFENKFAVMDVGANIGNHTLFFSSRCKSVLAFEPHPIIFQILNLNVKVNSINNVSVENLALSEAQGEVGFHFNENGNVGGSRIVGETEEGLANTIVKVVRGDDYFLEKKINKRVGLIKVDVEGHELSALKGLSELLQRQAPIILFEANSMEQRGAVVAHLEHQGYGFFGFLAPARAYSTVRPVRWFQKILTARQMHLYALQDDDKGPWPMCFACSIEVARQLNLSLR